MKRGAEKTRLMDAYSEEFESWVQPFVVESVSFCHVVVVCFLVGPCWLGRERNVEAERARVVKYERLHKVATFNRAGTRNLFFLCLLFFFSSRTRACQLGYDGLDLEVDPEEKRLLLHRSKQPEKCSKSHIPASRPRQCGRICTSGILFLASGSRGSCNQDFFPFVMNWTWKCRQLVYRILTPDSSPTLKPLQGQRSLVATRNLVCFFFSSK